MGWFRRRGAETGSHHAQTLLDESFTQACFWILLRRAPKEPELRQSLHTVRAQGRSALVTAVTSSTEFRLRYREWQSGREEDRQPAALHDALAAIGSDETFVSACYRILFDRTSDEEGLGFYAGRLAHGATRLEILRGLAASGEFSQRVEALNPALGRLIRDVQLCELANPAKWDNPDWHALMRSLGVVPIDHASMHRKTYEYTQTLFGLQRLGRLNDDARVLSVGAGHECILYWLANHVRKVIATDLYDKHWQTAFGMEGDAGVLGDPAAFAPFPYRRDRLIFMRMDGSRLAFRDGSFDIVYSLSSIEHFGGFVGARRAVADMARVLVPGGVLVLATEWCVAGPATGEVFAPEQVRALIDLPELRLVEPIDDRVWSRYQSEPVDLRANRFQTPHMLLKDGDTVFTSVMMFLTKN